MQSMNRDEKQTAKANKNTAREEYYRALRDRPPMTEANRLPLISIRRAATAPKAQPKDDEA